jgi:hypothetical protein
MLEKALNSIKDDPNLTILNSNNINKNSTDKKSIKKLSDDQLKFNKIINEVKQDLNTTDQVYQSLNNKSDYEISGIFKENTADISSPNN